MARTFDDTCHFVLSPQGNGRKRNNFMLFGLFSKVLVCGSGDLPIRMNSLISSTPLVQLIRPVAAQRSQELGVMARRVRRAQAEAPS
ncbi:hypothetical protein ACE6H2_025890 [Prunus campanulata]